MTNSDSTFGQSQQYASQGMETIIEARFSKSRLLDIYRMQQNSDDLAGNVSSLFVNNWDPGHPNSTNGRGWGKNNDTRDQSYGPEVCWDQSGQVQPIGLEEMSELEKTVRPLV
jgi:PERQ amino acid-rich with GYF domain-containing protein